MSITDEYMDAKIKAERELTKAELAGRWEEEYTNPYPEKTLWWWMAQLFNRPDKMP